MAGAAPITLDVHETGFLQKILRSRTLRKKLLPWTRIALAVSEHFTDKQIPTQYGMEEHRVLQRHRSPHKMEIRRENQKSSRRHEGN